MQIIKKIVELPIELYRNRKLIANLSKNDFKTKYAGSYLGTIWAFVQPAVTILVYWFVFEKGLKATGVSTNKGIDVPYILWLLAGLIPWFFFQDALMNGTNAFVEYSYLVKKVVFKISILPIIKIISVMFVHAFFLVLMVLIYMGYGFMPDGYSLQIIYYSMAAFMLSMSLVYITSAVVVFFRDLTQIINIVLQVGMWMTPIMWKLDSMDLPAFLVVIFKLNPMYYIVAGYRDAMINKVAFWEHPLLTGYYWGITVILFVFGTIVFKKLKTQFADVL